MRKIGRRVTLSFTDSHPSNADPFLENLKPYDKLYTTTDMKLAGRASSHGFRHDIPEHMKIAVDFARLLLEFCDVADILELRFGEPVLVLTAESTKNVTGLGLSADFDKPARGLGEEPDDGEEEQ